MSSEFGTRLKISVFGQSHGRAVGVVVDGLPAGEAVDRDALLAFLARRRPGGPLATPRGEPDLPVFLSGLERGVTCGAPLCAVIENTDTRSGDYDAFRDTPRPSHADYTALMKYGPDADLRGGGHFSGRLTAPLCVAGGIALQILARRGIHVGAHLASVGGVSDQPFPLFPTPALFAQVAARPIPTLDEQRGAQMAEEIARAASDADSVGGVVECAAVGLPVGLGGPLFSGLEGRLAAALFGIPAIKGVEFGAGFSAAGLRGSVHNDPFVIRNGRVETETNHHGGILGGITSGMPLVLRTAVKPTPSIGLPQSTVRLSDRTPARLEITGRHDPCVALRAVPVVEAVTAAVLLDLLLEEIPYGTFKATH
ncbi:MAG: chorismate synthase [Clostridiales bacterium]|nr:chorismate synthase [Clostridiales bacterium]